MSRRDGASLFVGRLSKNARTRDVEEIFELYGRMARCEVKYAYAFVDFEDRRDAEDALRYENGRDLLGSSIVVEWAKGTPRRPAASSSNRDDLCYKCSRAGHWARDCPDERGGGRRGGGSRYDSRRRSRSRSPDRRRRSRSRSRDRRRRRRSPSRSRSRSMTPKRSRRTRSPSRSPSKSPRGSPNGSS